MDITFDSFCSKSIETVNKFPWEFGGIKSTATLGNSGNPEWLIIKDFLKKKSDNYWLFGSITGSSSAYYLLTNCEQTSGLIWDVEMAQLEAISKTADEQDFIHYVNNMDWNNRPATDFVKAVRLALSAGAHLKARNLAQQGAKLFPDHAELKKFAKILAPPVIKSTDEPPDSTLRANRDWISNHWNEYRGRWIAIKAGQLLGVASTLKELIKLVGDPRGKHILVTRV